MYAFEEGGFSQPNVRAGSGLRDGFRVFGAGADKEVHVLGVAGEPVIGQGVGSDDEELNFVRVQQSDKLSQVAVELHRRQGRGW